MRRTCSPFPAGYNPQVGLTTHLGGKPVCFGRRAHRRDDSPEIVERQALLQNEPGAQERGARSRHRQVVHRAEDRQLSDVAAREKKRVDDVAVRGEREPRASEFEDRGVEARRESRVVEGREKDLFEQAARQPPAAAVRELNRRARADRRRARHDEFVVGHGRPILRYR